MTKDKISPQSLNSPNDTTGNKTHTADHFHYNCQTPQVLNSDSHKGGNSKGVWTQELPFTDKSWKILQGLEELAAKTLFQKVQQMDPLYLSRQQKTVSPGLTEPSPLLFGCNICALFLT